MVYWKNVLAKQLKIKQKRWILGMLMATLDASLFENLSAGKATISRQGVIHWITLYANDDNDGVTYFESSGVEYIPKEIKNLIGKRHIITKNFKTLKYQIFSI